MESVQHVANGNKLINNIKAQQLESKPSSHYKSHPFSSKYANSEILWALKMELPSVRF